MQNHMYGKTNVNYMFRTYNKMENHKF